ncbi:hypothetical protein PQO03_03070 [Lentisphaera profundi]|uniref:Uncharacterized protein n=1 Tax=Lentisphaera profundi TaxID=1658616 RepID=A0ABY7VVU2_9BACT|nr:hypothetical protein [Lentisphaera profundi]WDE96941.1 hypothetical protein PQO03_03070 [Lentisphaera profundi]
MKLATLCLLFFSFYSFADKQDILKIDLNNDLKFSLDEQNSWIVVALEEFEKYKVRGSSKIRKKLSLIFSSDIDKNNIIDPQEERIIRARLAAICYYYEQLFSKYASEGDMKKIDYQYPSMIPAYDLIDPFKDDKDKISPSLTPLYF